MSAALRHPDPELLRQFSSLQGLADDQLRVLAKSLTVLTAKNGALLIKRGATDAYSFLLLSGQLELLAGDGARIRVAAGSDKARNAISELLPRKYDVTALTPVEYLELDGRLLEELRKTRAQFVVDENDYRSSNGKKSTPAEELLTRLKHDLQLDQLVLPSLPDVAVRIGQALDDDISDAKIIAQMIQTDPAITAKIVKTANSAFYAGSEKITSCSAAIVRLGLKTTHSLVVSFALSELFKTHSPLLKKRMQALWQHSTHVGAICYVLAKITRQFNREHALLAGLLHDIGVVAVLSYAEHLPDLAQDAAQVDQAIAALRGEVGGLILRQWDFAEDFITAAVEAEEWMRDKTPEPDYCDLVIIAQLHSYVGTPRQARLPRLGDIPCFQKLSLGELTPTLSLKILEQAKDMVSQAETLVRG